jgi:hypothetical protein
LGGSGGKAVSIAGNGSIVGHSELIDGSMHASVWEGGTLVDIHPTGNRSSGVRAASPAGIIAGWVAQHPTEHGQNVYRPAIWGLDRRPTILSDMSGGWGEAVDVADEGLALGFVYHGQSSSAWVFNNDQLSFIGRPPAPCRSYIPYTIDRDGRVLGVQIDIDDGRHIGTWHAGTWETDRLPPRTVVEAFSRDGRSAGRVQVDDLQVPWVREDHTIHRLPHLRHHNHTITAVVGDVLLGAAITQQCAHPVVWGRSERG